MWMYLCRWSYLINVENFWVFYYLGEDASLPITSGGSYQVLVNNVFYFTQRVVDKLWQGMFNKESKLLVDFIIQLIAQVTGLFVVLPCLKNHFCRLCENAWSDVTKQSDSDICLGKAQNMLFFLRLTLSLQSFLSTSFCEEKWSKNCSQITLFFRNPPKINNEISLTWILRSFLNLPWCFWEPSSHPFIGNC